MLQCRKLYCRHRRVPRVTQGLLQIFVLGLFMASLSVMGAMQGNKKERLSEEEAVASVEEFCMAVHDKWPNCLVQFEGERPRVSAQPSLLVCSGSAYRGVFTLFSLLRPSRKPQADIAQ